MTSGCKEAPINKPGPFAKWFQKAEEVDKKDEKEGKPPPFAKWFNQVKEDEAKGETPEEAEEAVGKDVEAEAEEAPGGPLAKLLAHMKAAKHANDEKAKEGQEEQPEGTKAEKEQPKGAKCPAELPKTGKACKTLGHPCPYKETTCPGHKKKVPTAVAMCEGSGWTIVKVDPCKAKDAEVSALHDTLASVSATAEATTAATTASAAKATTPTTPATTAAAKATTSAAPAATAAQETTANPCRMVDHGDGTSSLVCHEENPIDGGVDYVPDHEYLPEAPVAESEQMEQQEAHMEKEEGPLKKDGKATTPAAPAAAAPAEAKVAQFVLGALSSNTCPAGTDRIVEKTQCEQ